MRIPGFLALLALAVACPLLADTVSIDPAVNIVSQGEVFSLDVKIANITDLYAFQFDLGFDPKILNAVSVTEGSFLPSGGSTIFVPGTIDNIGGTITFNADTLVGAIPGVSGSGTLAGVEFDAIASGMTAISLANVQLLDSGLNSLDFATSDGSVTVQNTPTPEPSYLALLGLGLLATTLSRSRDRQRS